MFKMKSLLSLLTALVLSLSLTACGGGSSQSNASSGSTGGSDGGGLPAMEFTVASSAASANNAYTVQVNAANAITEKSDGLLTFRVTWDGTLGNDSELIENCMTGSIPVISVATSPFLSYIPEIAVFDMPAVYDSKEEAYAGIAEFKDSFNEIFAEKNLVILALGFEQFRGLSSDRRIETPADFSGLKIRTMENKYHMAFWANLGASPTPLAFSELYLSLQQGLVNAQDNPITAIYASKFYEVQDYVMPITAFPFVNMIVMNKDTYDALPDEYKALMEEFGEIYLSNAYAESDETDRKAFADIGDEIEILEYTDEIKAALREAAQPVWDQIAADIGSEITEAYLATSKSL